MEEKGNDDNEGPSRWECWILLLLLGANYGEKGRMARGEPSECGECRVWVGTSLVSFSRSFTTRPLHHRTAVLSSVVTETRVLPIQGFPVVHCTSSSLAHSLTRSQPPSLSLVAHTTPSLCPFSRSVFPLECWLEGQTLESSGLTNRRTRKQQ